MPPRKIRGRWGVDFRFQDQRIRRLSPINSKTAAWQFERELQEQLESQAAGPRALTFRSFAQQWIDTYVKANNQPSRIETNKSILRNHLIPRFGDFDVRDITTREIEAFKCDLREKKGLAPATINNILATLRKSLNCAVEWKVLDEAPRCRTVRVPRTEVQTLSEQTQRILLEDQSEPTWNLMITLALQNGLRLGELLALRWQDIDFQSGTIAVTGSMNILHKRAIPKSGRTRRIPMGSVSAARLAETPRIGEYLFERSDGEPYNRHAASTALTRIVRRLGIKEHVHWHKFRHTCATNLANNIGNLRVVQKILGHASVTMTERYAHVTLDSMHAAFRRMEEDASGSTTEHQKTRQ